MLSLLRLNWNSTSFLERVTRLPYNTTVHVIRTVEESKISLIDQPSVRAPATSKDAPHLGRFGERNSVQLVGHNDILRLSKLL